MSSTETDKIIQPESQAETGSTDAVIVSKTESGNPDDAVIGKTVDKAPTNQGEIIGTAKTKAKGTGKTTGHSLTPAMRQYVEQKKRVGEAVLLFRMGDFYETFYDDAVLCSKVLGIALTSRNKNSDNPIPLAGIPYHALDGYLKKLVVAGYKVAISEQLEDAKQAQGVVKRDVVRIVTAGTLTDESLLTENDDNTLACVCIRKNGVGMAIVELSSGRFEVFDATNETLLDQLVRYKPAELLIDDQRDGHAQQIAQQLHQICTTATTRRPAHEFSNYQVERSLLEHFDVSTLAGFGFHDINASLCAAGVLIQYLQETQKTALPHITSIKQHNTSTFVQIDHASWRSLEIDRTLRTGSTEGSLLHAIDRTVHPIGARTLMHWLRNPLIETEKIIARQSAIECMKQDEIIRSRTRRHLKSIADVQRIASRIALQRTSPRDLFALAQTLNTLPKLIEELTNCSPTLIKKIVIDLNGLEDLAELLQRALKQDPPLSSREGGFIADGYDAELDRLRNIRNDGQTWLAEYQKKQIEHTGVSTLKVGYNRVFGYYIEITNASRPQVPPEYVRKQTIKNAERYITDELKTYENEVLTAQDKANEIEFQLFDDLCKRAATNLEKLMQLAGAIGRLDVIAGLAELAIVRRYVKPEIVDDGRLEIIDGRHPVLDQTLGDEFIPNDCNMIGDDARIFVITGPNMAGKSTYIRQTALLTLLAQTGSFVPAGKMVFTPVDRVFARVGSADEIMRGQSTFMVEMTEAANILHYATERSLVVLDELGRGTSTFDGLSLAWAITEHLANEIRCRTLIATHYHELTELAELFRGVLNYNVAVREYNTTSTTTDSTITSQESSQEEGIVFLHKIVEGGASKSYGIHVARLAGIPKTVIERSREVMEELQRGFERESQTPQLSRKKTKDTTQLELFINPSSELQEALKKIDPNQMTPIEALQKIIELKKRFVE